jgi:hypothetical protein
MTATIIRAMATSSSIMAVVRMLTMNNRLRD